MKNLIVLVCLAFSAAGMLMIAQSLESSSIREKLLKDATDEKLLEITADEWSLFCELMGLSTDSDVNHIAQTLDPHKYNVSPDGGKIALDSQDADIVNQWLKQESRKITYLQNMARDRSKMITITPRE